MPPATSSPWLIAQQPELDDLCSRQAGAPLLGLDTEFVRTETYRPQLCLVQVQVPGTLACVDTLANLDYRRFWSSLADAGTTVILHAAKQDLEVLLLQADILPCRIFDTQVAAGLLGHPPQFGYAALVEAELGVKLDKSQTRTDWSHRPLSAEQLAYAGEDVAHLPELHQRLAERLDRLGRGSWAAEDNAALLERKLYTPDPDRAWERLGGLPRLPAPMQARARRLAAWREVRAVEANRPRQWILADQVLMELAARNPGDLRTLAETEGMPPGLARRSGDALLAELRAANEALANGSLVLRQEARNEAPDPQRLKRLAEVAQKAAKELGISPELLATRRDMTALLRGDRDVRPLQGWRRNIVGEALAAAAGG